MNRYSVFIWISILIILLVSCNNDIAYENYETVEDNQWAIEDIKTFDAPIQDTLESYNVFLMIRNNGQYPWRNYKGIYEFEVQQGMRNDPLPGILDVGVLIKEHKVKD